MAIPFQVATLLTASALISSFGGATEDGKIPVKPLCPRCNVIVLAINALQATHGHHLGYPRPTTPFLDELASRGTGACRQLTSP